MPKFKDLTNKKFGYLKVLKISRTKYPKRWLCKCDCGTIKEISALALTRTYGNTVSCGCYKLNILKERSIKHGEYKTNLFKIWIAIKQRCFNKNNKAFHRYGGRGITIHPKWRSSFIKFKEYVEKIERKGETLDRIDNNKSYVPGNLRWVNPMKQTLNRSVTRWVIYKGKKMCLSHWAKEFNIHNTSVYYWYNKGKSIEWIKNRFAKA